jgi:hypothetical protein
MPLLLYFNRDQADYNKLLYRLKFYCELDKQDESFIHLRRYENQSTIHSETLEDEIWNTRPLNNNNNSEGLEEQEVESLSISFAEGIVGWRWN